MERLLSDAAKTALLHTPLSTPIAVGLENPEETGLAIRTAKLFAFRRRGLPLLVRPLSYQGKEGIWAAALAFRIVGHHKELLEGAVYLNPQNAFDLQLLQQLILQDQFPVLFLSPRLQTMINHVAEWTVHHRQELRMMLAQAAHAHGSTPLAVQETDPDFERVKQEFEKMYSIPTLLTLTTAGMVRASSPFRGVVLD